MHASISASWAGEANQDGDGAHNDNVDTAEVEEDGVPGGNPVETVDADVMDCE